MNAGKSHSNNPLLWAALSAACIATLSVSQDPRVLALRDYMSRNISQGFSFAGPGQRPGQGKVALLNASALDLIDLPGDKPATLPVLTAPASPANQTELHVDLDADHIPPPATAARVGLPQDGMPQIEFAVAQDSPPPLSPASPAPLGRNVPGAIESGRLTITSGKSLILDTPADLRRVSVANPDLAEAVAIEARQLEIIGKAAGETTVIVWQENGTRTLYDLTVRANLAPLEALRREIQRECGQDIHLEMESDTLFLRGNVGDLVSATRAARMAGAFGKVVNLLRVDTPPAEIQILLKVRFADVDRSAAMDLGVNLLSTGAGGTIGQTTTGQFGAATPQAQGNTLQWTLSEALNIFLFRPNLNLGMMIKALQSQNLLQMLAEPNVLATNGKPASFVAGGEFPFPVVQGGAGVGAVTIQFREYGVRIHFLPVVTPRGTIRLQVAPEVSSLDFANALQFQGYTIPALATRRVETEVELESGQSFVIAGLIDNNVTETINKIPGLGDIPLLGKLFRSRSVTKNNSELLVLITPELVRPIPAGAPEPTIPMPREFLKDGSSNQAPRTPGAKTNGPVPPAPSHKTVPVEELLDTQTPVLAVPATPTGPASAPATGGK